MEKAYKDYYNECLYILLNYSKIKNNPRTKVKSLTKVLLVREIIFIVLTIITIIAFIISKYIPILILTSIIILLLAQNMYTHILASNRIKNEMKTTITNNVKSKVTPKKNEIVVTKEVKDDNNKKIKLSEQKSEWDDILYVIINKYTICYLPKKDATKIICASINEQERILKDIDKYNRRDLLIDNSDLYK